MNEKRVFVIWDGGELVTPFYSTVQAARVKMVELINAFFTPAEIAEIADCNGYDDVDEFLEFVKKYDDYDDDFDFEVESITVKD